MSTKHEVAGGWVLLRDLDEVTERGRRSLRAVMFRLAELPGMDSVLNMATSEGTDREAVSKVVEANSDVIALQMGDGMKLIDEMADMSIMARVKQWSFTNENGVDLPVAVDSLLDLPGDAYDALKELCKDLPTGLDLEPSPDPKAPTPSITA